MPPRARDSPLRSSRASEAESPGNAPAITVACAVVREDPVDVLDPRRQRDEMRRELVGRIRSGARAHRVPREELGVRSVEADVDQGAPEVPHEGVVGHRAGAIHHPIGRNKREHEP